MTDAPLHVEYVNPFEPLRREIAGAQVELANALHADPPQIHAARLAERRMAIAWSRFSDAYQDSPAHAINLWIQAAVTVAVKEALSPPTA